MKTAKHYCTSYIIASAFLGVMVHPAFFLVTLVFSMVYPACSNEN